MRAVVSISASVLQGIQHT